MNKTIKPFLSQNWFNLTTLIVAVAALGVSLQSNSLARRANQISLDGSTARMEVIDTGQGFDQLWVSAAGCFQEPTGYTLIFHTSDVITFVNKGGLSASLVKASFSMGKGKYTVTLYQIDPEKGQRSEKVPLPLDIEAGKGRVWILDALGEASWSSPEEALSMIKSSGSPLKPIDPMWIFTFSDGSTVRKEYPKSRYTIQPGIERHIYEKCTH